MNIDNLIYPKVTICVPVRNGALTIKKTLDSLLSQDYPNYEIIVSDNCSDDNTAEMVQSYSKYGVKYYFNSKLEKWGESNWNYILKLAEGPFIVLYHADDIYAPSIIREQVEFLFKYPHASAVFTMSELIDQNDNSVRRAKIKLPKEIEEKELFYYEEFLNYTLKYTTFVVVPTMMTKKEIIDKVGMFRYEKYATASDIDLYLRMAKIGPIGVINKPLHKYRLNSPTTQKLLYRRTFSAHFFDVMDDYLIEVNNKNIVNKESLSVYKMLKATDRIYCIINMIIKDEISQPRKILINAFKLEDIFTAVKIKSKKIIFFIIGFLVILLSFIGLDKPICLLFEKLYFLWKKFNETPTKITLL
ncbi:MAG: glycosyltransferase [Candidatus Anstonellaceae archaeon]